jgi:cytoskeletal protein RodZ
LPDQEAIRAEEDDPNNLALTVHRAGADAKTVKCKKSWTMAQLAAAAASAHGLVAAPTVTAATTAPTATEAAAAATDASAATASAATTTDSAGSGLEEHSSYASASSPAAPTSATVSPAAALTANDAAMDLVTRDLVRMRGWDAYTRQPGENFGGTHHGFVCPCRVLLVHYVTS